jgi:hypothetical protein
MDFIKKHYEKVLLSIVLVGLAVAAAALPLQVSHVNQVLEETRTGVVRTPPKPFKPLDDYLKTNRVALQRLEGPADVKFSAIHYVFNPVEWRKRPDGGLVKIQVGNEIGAGLEVTKIDELHLVVSFEVGGEVSGVQQYRVTVLREAEKNPNPVVRTAKVGQRNDLFTILRVEGQPENPTALLLQLDKDQLTVPKNGGYNEIVGYAADLRYPLGKQVFPRRLKSDTIRLEDETYKIVTIERNQVVLSNEATHKRTTLKLNATAQVNPPIK